MKNRYKYVAITVFTALLAGCSGVGHPTYPYKTSGSNTALGAWEMVQTKMIGGAIPLYQVKDVQPKNILFVGKKEACHIQTQADGSGASAEVMDVETAAGTMSLANGPILPGDDDATYSGNSTKMKLQSSRESELILGGNILRRLPINNMHDALNYIEGTFLVKPAEARKLMAKCVSGGK